MDTFLLVGVAAFTIYKLLFMYKKINSNQKRLHELLRTQIPLNKNINKYLKLLTDKTTVSKKYKHTSSIKQEIYEIGGVTMSKEMRAILDDERAEGKAEGRAEGKVEGKIESFLSLVKKGLLELSVAAKELGMSESQFEKLVNN